MQLVLVRQEQLGMKAVAVLNARPVAHGMSIVELAYATRLTVTQHGDLMTKPMVVRKKCVKVQVTMTPILAVAVVLRKIPNTITT